MSNLQFAEEFQSAPSLSLLCRSPNIPSCYHHRDVTFEINNIITIIIIVVQKMKIPELSRGDETVAVLVEDAERLPDFLLAALITIKKNQQLKN